MNTNTIPLTFSPCTEAHEALIDYYFPTAVGRIFKFLTRRAKPGTSQQFDKDDFDQHCIKVGRKPYSKYWFRKCFEQLVSTRLVQVERTFRGYGYQVRVYHPWQIDDWIVDEFKNSQTSGQASPGCGADRSKNNHSKQEQKASRPGDRSSNRNHQDVNKTCSDVNKTCQKLTRDHDSSAGGYRESREKDNTKANPINGDRIKSTGDAPQSTSDRLKPKPIIKKTAFAAAPLIDYWLEDENPSGADGKEVTINSATGKKETAVSSPDNGGEHINCCPPESTGLKTNLNVNSGNVDNASDNDKNNGRVDKKVNKKSKKPNRPTFEVKINNPDWRSHLEQLDQLGVTGNKTIVNALKTFSRSKVEAAIALYRVRKRETGYIENPCGYFMQALKEDWAGDRAKQVALDNPQTPEDKAALFRYWFDLAKEMGYCSKSEIREDGERWVCMSGTWEKFTSAWERGYTLEYLRKLMKKLKSR